MYEKKRLLFLYAVSPVHMGAGTAVGVIDNPIQRERHTEFPVFAGSGLKGAFRDLARPRGAEIVNAVFGPETDDASSGAGALSISDAQQVLFPVRCAKRSYVYVTCPTALGRLRRLAEIAGVPIDWEVPSVGESECLLPDASPGLLTGNRLVLESFQFPAKADPNVKAAAAWIAGTAIPQGSANDYFRRKVQTDTVLLPDSKFGFFVRNATSVEPHVRIDDASGTADDGGLFYTENLPPESLLVCLAMASGARVKQKSGLEKAEAVMGEFEKLLDSRLVQIGGDASTGRGLVLARFAAEGGPNG